MALALYDKYLRSSVLGGQIAQEINSAGQTISYVYLPDGTQLSTLIGFPKWRHETPAGTGLYENYQSGFVSRVEFDPVRANVGLTAPPPPDTNGGDGEIGGNHNGGPTDSRFSDMANPAAGCYNVGGVDLPCTWSIFDVFDFFVWTPARNAAASAPSESLATWVPPKRVVPINIPNPFDKYIGVPVERVDTTYTPGYWSYSAAPFVNITIGQRSSTNPQSTGPNVDDLENRITKIVSNPDCAKFISDLINGTATAKNPAEFTDALIGFGMIKSQNGFIYGDTIRKAYGFDGATVHGSISGKTGQVELSAPIPFQSYGPVNKRAAAQYAKDQAGIQAMATLHEILHLAGKSGYDDFAFANTVAAMRGVKPPDFSGMQYRTAVRRASDYWNGALEAACKPR